MKKAYLVLEDGKIDIKRYYSPEFNEDEKITLSVDFAAEKNAELKIVYYLPLDVGNEAKNAEGMFELQFTASAD